MDDEGTLDFAIPPATDEKILTSDVHDPVVEAATVKDTEARGDAAAADNNLDLLTFSSRSSDLLRFSDPSVSAAAAVAADSDAAEQERPVGTDTNNNEDLLDLMGPTTTAAITENNNSNDLLMMGETSASTTTPEPPAVVDLLGSTAATATQEQTIINTNTTTSAASQPLPTIITDATSTATKNNQGLEGLVDDLKVASIADGGAKNTPASTTPSQGRENATSSAPLKVEATSADAIPASLAGKDDSAVPSSLSTTEESTATTSDEKPGTPSGDAIPANGDENAAKENPVASTPQSQDTTSNDNNSDSKGLKSDNSNTSSSGKTDGNRNPPEEEQQQSNDEISASANNKERIDFLEMELAKSKAALDTFKQQAESNESETAELIMALQGKLQQEMSLKAEAENKARLADAKIDELQQTLQCHEKEIEANADMQKILQDQMTSKAEAENMAKQLTDRNKELEAKVDEKSTEIDGLQRKLVEAREARAAQEDELIKIREQRDEQERKEHSLTNRLNAAKKKEAVQVNLAERYEDEIKAIEQDWQAAKKELTEVTERKNVLEKEFEELKTTSEERIRRAERALADELTINEERKQKMKAFVENRSEEFRQAKSDNDALQAELNQTNQSLMDLNNRWKQLHAQWVQSQTRNRELQRDLNRIKKDSENLHKVGDTLEMRLTRSATETEEHKNKRLAAKHELMTVLRTLEAERELSAKLRDGLKFTFTPKALSQQQLLHEGLEDFETQLLKLAQRLGRPLPPSTHNMAPPEDMTENSETSGADDPTNNGLDASKPSRTDSEIQNLIAKLEYETQRVSQGIMALAGNIERMHMVLDASGERTCYTVLGELLTSGTVRPIPAAATREETTSITGSGPSRRLAAIRSDRYSQVPPAAP